MDAECTRLVNLLGKGSKHILKRNELSAWLGISDRRLRKMIEQCQLEGVPIINMSNGYYKAESIEELRQYIRRERKRSEVIENKCKVLLYTEWFDENNF